MCKGIWKYKDNEKNSTYKSVNILMENYLCNAAVITVYIMSGIHIIFISLFSTKCSVYTIKWHENRRKIVNTVLLSE